MRASHCRTATPHCALQFEALATAQRRGGGEEPTR